MLSWLVANAGLAVWLAGLGVAAVAACAVVATVRAGERRARGAIADLCAVLHPVRALGETVRELRDAVERHAEAPRLAEVAALADGTLAQRIRDVRAAPLERLSSPRAIEAAYQAREAAARMMVWLERPGRDGAERRLRIQTIWKALHDAAGNLERDMAALERRK